jgi:hypothetical protein
MDETAPMSGVWIARSGDGLILLNLNADHYACIYDPRPEAGCQPKQMQNPETADSIMPELAIPTGLGDDARWSQCPWRGADWRDPECIDTVAVTIRDGLHFFQALLTSAFAFRRKPVRDLLRHIQQLPLPRTVGKSHAPAMVAAQFERLCLFLPFRMQCLFRSFFLLHFLRLQGHGADWVFGAGLFPFRAHCWLAVESRLVGERSHLIEFYEPLFTLRRRNA